MSFIRSGLRSVVLVVALTTCGGDSLDPAGGSVESIVVTPAISTVAVGATVGLIAQVHDASGTLLTDRAVHWSSEDHAIATVSESGVVTAVRMGTVQIAASAGGRSGLAQITVTTVPVASVQIIPGNQALFLGESFQFTAILRDDAGNVLSGRQVNWSTNNPGVATVTATGLVTALSSGGAIISATSGGRTAVASVTATSVPVASVRVQPRTQTLVEGQTAQLQAEPLDDEGQLLTGRVVLWTTSNPSVATVTSTGLVTAHAPGTATITATCEQQSSTTVVTVTGRPPNSVIVTPAQVLIQAGNTSQLTTQVLDDLGRTITDSPVTYSSSNATIATVSSTGLVSGVGAGQATITATSGGKSGTAQVTVTPIPVGSVVVSPAAPTIQIGRTVTMTAQALSASGQPLTGRTVTWSSSTPAIATITSSGVVTGVSGGSTVLFASIDGVLGWTTVTVLQNPVATVTVSPAASNVTVGQTTQFTAVLKDTQGATLTGRVIAWSSSATAIATVANDGVVTAIAPGSAIISATSEGQTGVASVTVVQGQVSVATVTVSPATSNVNVGQTAQLSAVTKDAAGNTLQGRAVTWSSTATNVATVDGTGLVTGVAAGSATITATSEGQTGTASVTVAAVFVPVASVTVSPTTSNINVGQTTQFTAVPKDAAGNALLGRVVTWSSSSGTATVSNSGLVTGVSAGSATITATSEGKSGTATVSVTLVPVATVSVSPTTSNITVGQTAQLTAVPRDAAGNALTGRVVTWSSSSAAATVSSTGLVTGVSVGSATISATSEGKTGTATVTVTGVKTMTVTPDAATIAPLGTLQLTAVLKDASGAIINNPSITWSSSNNNVARVSSSGRVTGLFPGVAVISAKSSSGPGGSVTGTATITVK